MDDFGGANLTTFSPSVANRAEQIHFMMEHFYESLYLEKSVTELNTQQLFLCTLRKFNNWKLIWRSTKIQGMTCHCNGALGPTVI